MWIKKATDCLKLLDVKEKHVGNTIGIGIVIGLVRISVNGLVEEANGLDDLRVGFSAGFGLFFIVHGSNMDCNEV